jgi:DNA-binding FrmR family transcriptional regulator
VKQEVVMSAEIQQDMLARMRRIEGQARGVQRMIADERDCLEILTQLASLRSAAYSVSVALTQHFAMQCVSEAGGQETPDDAMRGLVDVLLRAPH